MSLAETVIGTIVTIESVDGERSFRRRLLELGLVPGTRVQVMGVAPLGDPIELLVRGGSLSIRRSEASLIRVRPAELTLPTRDATRERSVRGVELATEARGAP